MYAVVKRLGKEAFDARVAARVVTGGHFILRVHGTPGLTITGGSEQKKEDVLLMSAETARARKKDQEEKYKAAPIGSQIVFTNLDRRSDDRAYENENTIKMGKDVFIAHGIIKGNKFVTREQILEVLANDALRGPAREDYKKRDLYISTIVLYGDT